MKRPSTRHLLGYWAELRADPANADRAASASTAIQFAVGQSFLLEAHAERDFPMRISGLRIDMLFMASMRQAGFLRLWRSADRAELADIMTTVMDEALPLIAGVRAAPAGREPIDLELILLPLAREGQPDGLLGGLTPATLAPWYGTEAITSLTLGPWRFLDGPVNPAPLPLVSQTARVCDQAMVRRARFAVIEGGLSAH